VEDNKRDDTDDAQTCASATDRSKGRAATRIASEYFLRSARLLSDLAGGDMFKGLILRAVIAANVGYIDQDRELSARYASLEEIPPDDLRRPVSVLAIAGSLGVPYETTRRYVNALIAEGKCVRVNGGVIAPAAAQSGAELEKAMVANMGNIRRFVRSLRRAGIDFD